MEQSKRKELQLTAAKARLLGVQMVHDAASGHPGGSMSCMDVLTYLYFAEMHVDPKNPHDPERDRFVMSKGHCSPAVYPTLALRGFFPVEDLKMFRRIDGHMSGHVEMKYVPGVDMSTGSLGQGISVAVGMALAGKVAQKDYRVYAILGDGEVAEGQVWEAMMAANKYHLDNLCACVDVNGLQIDGATKDVMPTEPLDLMFEAFGWHVIQIDGHDFAQIEAAFADLNVRSVTVTVVENQGRDVGAFLCDLAPQLRDYDYACFMHDKKAIQTRPGSVGASFGYVCNENVCKNTAHVLNVLCEFEKDPYLGILCPPYPTHGLYFMNMCSGGWGPNFENTKKLMKDLGIDVPVSGEKSPIAPYGSVLWFRPKALEPLFDHGWQHSDFPPEPLPQDGTISHAIERIYPFVAQSAGYYPAVVMSKSYAVTHNDTMQAYAGGVIRPLARVFDCTTFYGAVSSATGFAYKKHHLFSHYGPYSDSRRRHARNWLRDKLPAGSYKVIINTKRAIFGPHEGPYED